ncbi:MAG TPA: ABC transporter permease [Pseudonocardiaceae bacterium]|jgi:oleandomycin transport system permease protein|nr:ABC transporter permease [Pseudonocardiaceae bacterium]
MTELALEPSAAAHRYVSPARTIRHGLTLAGRSIVKIRKNPEVLLDVTIQPILFLVLFVFLFGGAISGDWHTYLQTLVPGILAQGTLMASVGTGIALGTDITKGVFDRFRSLPIARSAPLIGAVIGDSVRFLTATAVTLIFAVIIGFRIHTSPLALVVAIVIMLLAGLALCWIGVFVSMLVRSPQSAQGVLVAFILPLSFGSNVFVPSGSLPGFLHTWATISPVSQLANMSRGLLIGGPVAGPLLASIAWLAGIVAVFFPLAMVFYRRRMA